MPLLDTRRDRDLTGTLIADIVLQLLSYVAQTEREFIRQRQAEGIAAARQQGVKFGRRPMERPPGYERLSLKVYLGNNKMLGILTFYVDFCGISTYTNCRRGESHA